MITVAESLSDQLALVQATLVPVDEIYLDHEWNSRGEFSTASIVELAESIRDNGLRDPILVRTTSAYPGYKYVVVYGHRRLAAHRYLNRTLIPAKVTTLPENTALILNIKENLERVDVNFLQQAKGIWRLMDMGYSFDMLKSSLRQSSKWINQRILLRKMPEQVHALAALGIFKPAHVDRFQRIPTLGSRMLFLRKLRDGTAKVDKGDYIANMVKKEEDKPKTHPNDVRKITAIDEMQKRIQSVFGTVCPEAAALAWAAGWWSDEEMYDWLEKRAVEEGKFFRRPEAIPMSAVG